MTVRLFDQDAYIKEFEAVVTACEPGSKAGEYFVCLDRTAFYPEGGGQPGDTGEIDRVAAGDAEGKDRASAMSAHVLDTFEKAGEIIHRTDRPFEKGTPVRGRLDWERRFSLMQNHSGEHIVSGLIHEKYGYENVGFHMGSDFLTIDLSGELTMEMLGDIQRRANEVVWQDVKTDITVYESSAAIPFHYRSKKELPGQVRIVTFPGADVCACCGTHVSTTGQIGLIKLISCVRFKGGVRIEMLCGKRALDYMESIWQQNLRISHLLSARPLQTADAVERVAASEQAARFELIRLEKQREEDFAAGMSGRGNVLIMASPMADPQGVRRLADAVMKYCKGVCAVFSGTDETDYKYAIGEQDGDVRELVKTVNASLGGRGGGKPFFAQGNVCADRDQIVRLFTEAVKQPFCVATFS